MLPVITEDLSARVFSEVFEDMPAWRRSMIHYIKDENPEINTAIIEIKNKTDLDPNAIALGAYLTYLLLEKADMEQEPFEEDE
ncbi:hypothetical protein J6S88_02295 [bacterium]|nr:hypothetical protein [bacterium]